MATLVPESAVRERLVQDGRLIPARGPRVLPEPVEPVRAVHHRGPRRTAGRQVVIYLDTSALAKLIVRETETAALDQWLRPRAAQLRVTSIIGRVELVRVTTCFAAAN